MISQSSGNGSSSHLKYSDHPSGRRWSRSRISPKDASFAIVALERGCERRSSLAPAGCSRVHRLKSTSTEEMNGASAKRSRSKSSRSQLGASLLGMLALVTSAAPADLNKRWVYLATNPSETARVDEAVSVIRRAAAAGYNGVVVTGGDRPGATEGAYGSGVERMR